jgi:hypothetical protein
MSGHESMLHGLLEMTQRGPVFGPRAAFGEIDDTRKVIIHLEAGRVQADISGPVYDAIFAAAPDKTDEQVEEELAEILPKTVAFVPALTAGELDTRRGMADISLAAQAVAAMYWTDQMMDRGDEAMLLAVEDSDGQRPSIPRSLSSLVESRKTMLGFMHQSIEKLSGPDAPDVSVCFSDLVLGNEAKSFRLSQGYFSLGEQGRQAFLDKRARLIAELMVKDAGFQSVSSSLHTAYRKTDPSLPSIAEIHGDQQMQRNIQTWNAVARVADECGDWWMDMGNSPEFGVPSINPFNQYHPELVRTLCRLAGIAHPAVIHEIDRQFQHFHDSDEDRETAGAFVTGMFFNQMRNSITGMSQDFRKKYDKYIELSMRVGEISFVNMLGDIALGKHSSTG